MSEYDIVIDSELRNPDNRALKYYEYVSEVGEGEVVSRRDMMERMGRSYSTVMYSLERAVSCGLLHKQWGFVTAEQPGWLYALPGTMPRLEGLE